MRRALGFVALAACFTLGGCAVIAGYDFGSYTGRGGGGAGGEGHGGGTSADPAGGGGSNPGPTASSTGGGSHVGGGGNGTGGILADVTLYSGDDSVTSLAIDEEDVFFTTNLVDLSQGKVQRAAKDGSTTKTLVSGLFGPSMLALDGASTYLQTGDFSLALARVPKAGGAAIAVSTETDVTGVAAHAGFLYWSRVSAGEIARLNLGSGTLKTLVSDAGVPAEITADDDGVFWVDRGQLLTPTSRILSANPDGSGAHPLATEQDFPVAIATDDDTVYWATIHGGVCAARKDGTSGVKLYQPPNGSASSPIGGLTVFSGTLYFTQDQSLSSVATTGGTPAPIRSGIDGPRYVAVDATAIYLSTAPQISSNEALVIRIPR